MQNIDLTTKTNYLVEFHEDSFANTKNPRDKIELTQLRNGTFVEAKVYEYFDLLFEKEKEFLHKYFTKASGADLARGLLIGLENDAFTPKQIHGMAQYFGKKLKELASTPGPTSDSQNN